MSHTPPALKQIAVVGEKGVGKTCLVKRLLKEPVDFTTYVSTIDEAYHYVGKMPDGSYQQMQIIDTAPWNEFPAMQRLYVHMSHLIIAVYDASSDNWSKSITDVLHDIRQTREEADILVVGTKCDKLSSITNFTPPHVTEAIGREVIGHVYVSSVTQYGMERLNETILTKQSLLTRDHLMSDKTKETKLKKLNLKRRLRNLGKALLHSKNKEKDSHSRSGSVDSLDSVDGHISSPDSDFEQALSRYSSVDYTRPAKHATAQASLDGCVSSRYDDCSSPNNRNRHVSDSRQEQKGQRKAQLCRQNSRSTPHLLGLRMSGISMTSEGSSSPEQTEHLWTSMHDISNEDRSPSSDSLRRKSLKNSWKRKVIKCKSSERSDGLEEINGKFNHLTVEHKDSPWRKHKRSASDDNRLIAYTVNNPRSHSEGFTPHKTLTRCNAMDTKQLTLTS